PAQEIIYISTQNDLRRYRSKTEVEPTTTRFAHPYKEKRRTAAQPMEFSVVLRIEEAYLINAEANARIGRYEEAAEALNAVRNRAGLSSFYAGDAESWVDAVLEERRKEFFTEFGHRFYDLKRTGRLNVLQLVKQNWTSHFEKLPLPETELQLNQN